MPVGGVISMPLATTDNRAVTSPNRARYRVRVPRGRIAQRPVARPTRGDQVLRVVPGHGPTDRVVHTVRPTLTHLRKRDPAAPAVPIQHRPADPTPLACRPTSPCATRHSTHHLASDPASPATQRRTPGGRASRHFETDILDSPVPVSVSPRWGIRGRTGSERCAVGAGIAAGRSSAAGGGDVMPARVTRRGRRRGVGGRVAGSIPLTWGVDPSVGVCGGEVRSP